MSQPATIGPPRWISAISSAGAATRRVRRDAYVNHRGAQQNQSTASRTASEAAAYCNSNSRR